jgi:hypothetical protein
LVLQVMREEGRKKEGKKGEVGKGDIDKSTDFSAG